MARAVALAALPLLAACGSTAGPSYGEVFADRFAAAYVADDGVTKLVTVAPDGSDIREIPLPGGFQAMTIASIAWARDHRWLAFSAKPAGTATHYDLFVVRPTGGTPTNVTRTPDFDEWTPAWSPDGRQLAFERNGIISAVDMAGSGGERVLVGPDFSNGGNYGPDWSPDGTSIAYVTGNGAIAIASTVGAAESQVVYGAPGIRGRPTWKPDGSRLLFWETELTSWSSGGPERIVTIAPDGSDMRLVSSSLAGYLPVWSPDGTRIATAGPRYPFTHLSVLTVASGDVATWALPGPPGPFAWR